MRSPGIEQTLNLVASQLEAASSLLKFAADDLAELLSKTEIALAEELRIIVRNLQAQAGSLDGNAAFCHRLGEAEEEDVDDFDEQADFLNEA